MGQEPEVKTYDALMSLGLRPAFEVYFPKTKEKRVKRMWKAFVKKHYEGKLKYSRRSGEYLLKEARSVVMYAGAFDLYTQIDSKGEFVTLRVWYDLGQSFLEERFHPTQTAEVRDVLRSFYFDVRRDQQSDKVDDATSTLEDAERALEQLVKKNESLHKDISGYREKIREAEHDILENERDQSAARTLIETRLRSVESARKQLNKIGKPKQ